MVFTNYGSYANAPHTGGNGGGWLVKLEGGRHVDLRDFSQRVTAQPGRRRRVKRIATDAAAGAVSTPPHAAAAGLPHQETGQHALAGVGWHAVGAGDNPSGSWWQLCPRGSGTYTLADSLLQSTWVRSDHYEFVRLLSVREYRSAELQARYDAYKRHLDADPAVQPPAVVINGNEQLVFHGCAAEAEESIMEAGFKKSYWKSSTGKWQRFGPGFYFALQASKSHTYPLTTMRALPSGTHKRRMILCTCPPLLPL